MNRPKRKLPKLDKRRGDALPSLHPDTVRAMMRHGKKTKKPR